MKFSQFLKSNPDLDGHAFVFVCGDGLLVEESRPVWQRVFDRDRAGGEWAFQHLTAKEFEALDARELMEEALSPPLFGPSRALMVTPAGKLTKKKMAVAKEIAALPSSSLKLVLVAESKRDAPRGAGLPAIEIDPLRPNDAARWLERRYRVNTDVAQYLVEVVGPELRVLAAEIEKLTAYVRGNRPLEVHDVDLLTVGTEQYSPFDLDDAILDGNAEKAVRVAGAMLEEGVEPLLILARVARIWRQLLTGKAAGGGGSPQDAAAAAGIPHWKASAFRSACDRFTWERIAEGFGALVRADERFKSTGAEKDLVLKLLLWSLIGSRAGELRPRSGLPAA